MEKWNYIRIIDKQRSLGRLTRQQYRTLKGQIKKDDPEAAMRGLRNIISRRGGNNAKEV